MSDLRHEHTHTNIANNYRAWVVFGSGSYTTSLHIFIARVAKV